MVARLTMDLFEKDGALCDLYVFGTSALDWQKALDFVRRLEPPATYQAGGQQRPLPATADEALRESGMALLTWWVCGVQINSNFFVTDEIEFDIDPRQIIGPEQLDAVADFMLGLSSAVGKPVVLTPENGRDIPIAWAELGEIKIVPDKAWP